MARSANGATDFVVPVDGVGVFTFAKKRMRDQVAIECEYSRLTEGIETVTNFLDIIAAAISALKVLTVSAPDGWDVDDMDPEDSDSYQKLMKVWGALRDKQASFRTRTKIDGKGTGTGSGGNSGVLVPAQVQPAAE